MKSGRWTLIFVSPKSIREYYIRIPKFILVLLLILGIMSAVGLVNCLRFGVRYGYANFCVNKQLKIKRQAILKVQFLKKLAEQKKSDIEKLVKFEDNVRLKYGMNPISEDVRRAGIGGKPSEEELIIASFEDTIVKKAIQNIKDVESLNRQVDLLSATFSRMNKHVIRINDLLAQSPSIWPVRGRITSGFGFRFHPFFRRNKFHKGIDIANNKCSPIFSTAAGIVTVVGRKNDMGNIVTITHKGSGYTTCYAHLLQATVVEGQVVNRGELIGYIGNTGQSTGPHLHYEVTKNGKHINPMNCILPSDIVVD